MKYNLYYEDLETSEEVAKNKKRMVKKEPAKPSRLLHMLLMRLLGTSERGNARPRNTKK